MLVSDIFELATSLIFERVGEDADTQYFTPAFMTITLQECLPHENQYRMFKGLEPLEEAPTIHSLNEEVEFVNPTLLKVAIPYNLASQYYRDNNDQYHEIYYRNLFVSACSDAAPYIVGDIVNEYN